MRRKSKVPKRKFRNRTRSNKKFKGGRDCSGLSKVALLLCKNQSAAEADHAAAADPTTEAGYIKFENGKYYNKNNELVPNETKIEQQGVEGVFYVASSDKNTITKYYIKGKDIMQPIDPTKQIQFTPMNI